MWTKKGKGLACLVPAPFQGRWQAPFQRQAPGSLLSLFPHTSPNPPFSQQQLKPCSCHAAGKGRQKQNSDRLWRSMWATKFRCITLSPWSKRTKSTKSRDRASSKPPALPREPRQGLGHDAAGLLGLAGAGVGPQGAPVEVRLTALHL